jgi:hypothetical protein
MDGARIPRRNIIAFALILLVLATSHTESARAVDLVIDGNIVFREPNQGGAKGIRASNTDDGLRIYNGQNPSPIPEDAAVQFVGNTSTSYPGRAHN